MNLRSDVTVNAELNYTGAVSDTPRVVGNDHSAVPVDSWIMPIRDARFCVDPPSLAREGFALMSCPTAVKDFRDADEVSRVYPGDIRRFIKSLTGADEVVVSVGAILRFGERSAEAHVPGTVSAARRVHSDVSDRAAAGFARESAPTGNRRIRRIAQHNIWRVFSDPPQDVPLTLCDARTVVPTDLIVADFFSDARAPMQFSFEILLVHYNPAHRWWFFSDMRRDEAIIFKRHDTDEQEPSYVPHSAFTDSRVSLETAPRASVEIRTIAYWYQ